MLRLTSFLLYFLLFVTLSQSAAAQQTYVTLKSDVLIGSGSNPLWLKANQFGLFDNRSSSINQFISGYGRSESEFGSLEIKASGMLRTGNSTTAIIHELYIKSVLKSLSLTIGKQEFTDGYIQNRLAVGSITFSSNAPTIPMVMLSFDDWQTLPLTADLFQFKGYYAHGWLEEDRFVKNTYLHMKELSLKLGKQNWPVQFLGTLNHNVQWAGTHPVFSDLPDSFRDYFNVVTAQKGAPTSDDPEPVSFQGNTLGRYEFGIAVPMQKSELLIAKQFFIESAMGVRFRSPADGLWSLQWRNTGEKRKLIDYAVYQLVNTLKQDSKRGEGEIRGADRYYTNFIYQDGWTHQNRLMGLPLVGVRGIRDNGVFIFNNIIIAHHLGTAINLDKIFQSQNAMQLGFRLTYSRNYGLSSNCPGGELCDPDNQPNRTPRIDQWYSSADLRIRYNSVASAIFRIGIDNGALSNSLGAMAGVQYNLQ